MIYKLLKEQGDYTDSTGAECNLLEATEAHTPEGVNVGWTELSSKEEAETFFGVRKKLDASQPEFYEEIDEPIKNDDDHLR